MDASNLKQKKISGFPGLLLYAGLIVLGFLLVGLLSFYIETTKNGSREDANAVVQGRLKTLGELREQDKQALTTYGWVDKNAGIVRIPIDRSMELALPELQQRAVTKTNIKVEAPVVGTQPAAK